MKKTQRRIVTLALPIFLFLVKSVGIFLDMEAERVTNQLFKRENDNIIVGAEEINFINSHNAALVLVHGHMETAQVFEEVVDELKEENAFDIYVPLAPFHGRTLEIATKLDNKIVYEYYKKYINNLSKKYKKITVVAFSYGGTHFANLARNNALPENVNLLLYAPGIHIKTNHLAQRIKLNLYSMLFRKYCNYESIGCQYPYYKSGDDGARIYLDKEISLRYRIVPAVLELYKYDLSLSGVIKNINRSFKIIVAKNDNRVFFNKINNDCKNNAQCSLIVFDNGKHLLHYSGSSRREFLQFVKNEAFYD